MASAASYAMTWQTGDGLRRVGRIEVGSSGLELCETGPSTSVERIRYLELDRAVLDRRVLRLCRPGRADLRVASLDNPGTLRELAERVWAAALPAGGTARTCATTADH
ncbi:MAG: hypothetical protein ACRDM1_03490 [Gaiellaceae bacterium]